MVFYVRATFGRELEPYTKYEQCFLEDVLKTLMNTNVRLPTEIVAQIVFKETYPKSVSELLLEQEFDRVNDILFATGSENILFDSIYDLFTTRLNHEAFDETLWELLHHVNRDFLGIYSCEEFMGPLQELFEFLITREDYELEECCVEYMAALIYRTGTVDGWMEYIDRMYRFATKVYHSSEAWVQNRVICDRVVDACMIFEVSIDKYRSNAVYYRDRAGDEILRFPFDDQDESGNESGDESDGDWWYDEGDVDQVDQEDQADQEDQVGEEGEEGDADQVDEVYEAYGMYHADTMYEIHMDQLADQDQADEQDYED